MAIVWEEKGVMSCVGGGVSCEGASSSHTYFSSLGRETPPFLTAPRREQGVLVLPNIKMNPPQVYMCSPS